MTAHDSDNVGRFRQLLDEAFQSGIFVKLALSHLRQTAGAAERATGRLIELATGQYLSVTFHYPTRHETQNLPLAQAGAWVERQLTETFRSALLRTTKRDWQLHVDPTGKVALTKHKPSHTAVPPRTHDQPKETVLDHTATDWLHGLGVVAAGGRVRAAMADKHRQINRYLEIFTHLADECGWTGREPKTQNRQLVVADMGCGKGYLTFGVWHLFHRVWQVPVRVIGVEARSDLVTTTNKLARQIAADGLEFVTGTIDSAAIPKPDALIALHACNTATDDAIRRGIALGAKLIVVAPCCHKEVRPQLGRPEPLAPVLAHGIMAERMAEWVTDGLRALHLEAAGYRTKVFEFVASDHTPKNLMIAAIHTGKRGDHAPVERLKEFFGIRQHALD